MNDKYLGCSCWPSGEDFCTWKPVFTDSSSMNIDLGSDVKPIIGTANDYALSENKPSINGVTLIGDKSNEELHIGAMSNMDIENILNSFI